MKYLKIRIAVGTSDSTFDIFYNSPGGVGPALLFDTGLPAVGITYTALLTGEGVTVSVPDDTTSIILDSSPSAFCTTNTSVNDAMFTIPIGCVSYTVSSSAGIFNYYYTDCDCVNVSATIDATYGYTSQTFCALQDTVNAGLLTVVDNGSCVPTPTPTQTPTNTATPTPSTTRIVICKSYELSFAGIPEDTFVNYSYTDCGGIPQGASGYVGEIGTPIYFCAELDTVSSSTGVITVLGDCVLSPTPTQTPTPTKTPTQTPTTTQTPTQTMTLYNFCMKIQIFDVSTDYVHFNPNGVDSNGKNKWISDDTVYQIVWSTALNEWELQTWPCYGSICPIITSTASYPPLTDWTISGLAGTVTVTEGLCLPTSTPTQTPTNTATPTVTPTPSTTPPPNSVEFLGDELPAYGGVTTGGFTELNGTVEIIGDPVTFRAYVYIPDEEGYASTSLNIGGNGPSGQSRYVELETPNSGNAYSPSFILPAGFYTWQVIFNWNGIAGSLGEGGIDWTQ